MFGRVVDTPSRLAGNCLSVGDYPTVSLGPRRPSERTLSSPGGKERDPETVMGFVRALYPG